MDSRSIALITTTRRVTARQQLIIEKYLHAEDVTHACETRSILTLGKSRKGGGGGTGGEAIDKRARDKTASAPQSVQRGRVFFLSSPPHSRYSTIG